MATKALYLFLAVTAAPSPALACSVVVPVGYEGSAEQLRDVQRAIANATAIVDGEVVAPSDGNQPTALVYAHRVFKGPTQRWFRVASKNDDSCAIALTRLGERRRMILVGGPAEYVLYRDGSEARVEDRILRSDRRREYRYFAGPRRSDRD